MKNIILLSLSILFIFSSCKKNEPVIADNSEMPVSAYHEQIYAQPIIVGEQIVTIVKNGSSTFLKSYDKNGNLNWEQNIGSYIFTENTYDDIENIRLSIKLNQNNEIVLNIDNWDSVKLIKFSTQGNFINEFEQTIHQPDTIFFRNLFNIPDTITNTHDSIPYFCINETFTLSNGNILILSHEKSELMDSTIFQFSLYNSTGGIIGHSYSFFRKNDPDQYEIRNFLDSKDNLLFIIEWNSPFLNPSIFKINLNTGVESYMVIPLQFSNIFTFFEDSNNNYVFTSEIYNDNSSSYSSLVFKINPTGEILWQKMYQINLASIFLSVNEVSDGYLFTGFNTSKNYDYDIDWRDNENYINERNTKAIVLKTDFEGNRIWNYSPQLQQEATFGGTTLYTDKFTFFGQRISNNIINTMFIDIDIENLPN